MIDFEAEGLLDELEGKAREDRLALLEELTAEGVPLEELREAVAAGRLTLLPVERALAGDGARYTPREIAEISGLELELVQRFSAALGVPYPDPDERSATEADLEAVRRVKAFRDAGLPEDGMLQVARTIGMGMARIAEANRELTVRTLMQPGDTERDLALRFAAAAEHMLPLVGPTLVYAFQAHLLEQIRRDVIGAADLASGELRGTADLTVCFADLVEFTRLGEEIAPEELGAVAGRFEEMATVVAEPPVRLVKMIGDAAMLVSTEVEPMVGAALRLIEMAEDEGRGVPVPARRCRPRPDTGPGGRLLRARGQPGEPDHRHRPARQRPGRPGGQRDRQRRLLVLLRGRAPPQGLRITLQAVPRAPRARLGRLAAGDEQVVEELGGKVGLEQAGVDLLQGHVAAEGEAPPAPGDRFGLGARLDRAQAPAPGVGQQLLAADVAILEAGVAEQPAQVGGGKGVDVDLALERVAVGLLGLGRPREPAPAPLDARPARRSTPVRFGSAARRSP